MTTKEQMTLAEEEARAIVARLRKSNERAAKRGAPRVDDAQYEVLEKLVARKLLRA